MSYEEQQSLMQCADDDLCSYTSNKLKSKLKTKKRPAPPQILDFHLMTVPPKKKDTKAHNIGFFGDLPFEITGKIGAARLHRDATP